MKILFFLFLFVPNFASSVEKICDEISACGLDKEVKDLENKIESLEDFVQNLIESNEELQEECLALKFEK